jgi:hypothetical protein
MICVGLSGHQRMYVIIIIIIFRFSSLCACLFGWLLVPVLLMFI